MLRSPRPPVERAAGAVLKAPPAGCWTRSHRGPNTQQALDKKRGLVPGW